MGFITCYVNLFSYPISFIETQFRQFLLDYIPKSSFIALLNDERQFECLRRNILGQSTLHESQTVINTTHTYDHNQQTNNDIIQVIDMSESIPKNDHCYANKLIVHYTHEKRFSSFKRDMHHIYDQIFGQHISPDTRLIVGNRNRHDARKELIRKRPKRYLLINNNTKNTKRKRQV